jgi:hypothetical protein
MRKPSGLMRTWLLAAAIGIAGAMAVMNPAEAARRFGGGGGHWHGGGGHWHGGGGHWHGNWHGHGGCWNCGWGWGAAGFATGLALGAGYPYYGYGYGYPYYAAYDGCRLVRHVYHSSHGTYVRRVRVCY